MLYVPETPGGKLKKLRFGGNSHDLFVVGGERTTRGMHLSRRAADALSAPSYSAGSVGTYVRLPTRADSFVSIFRALCLPMVVMCSPTSLSIYLPTFSRSALPGLKLRSRALHLISRTRKAEFQRERGQYFAGCRFNSQGTN